MRPPRKTVERESQKARPSLGYSNSFRSTEDEETAKKAAEPPMREKRGAQSQKPGGEFQ